MNSFTNVENWPHHVGIREWFFKPKPKVDGLATDNGSASTSRASASQADKKSSESESVHDDMEITIRMSDNGDS